MADPLRPAPPQAWSARLADRWADRWADVVGRLPGQRPVVVGAVVAVAGAAVLAGVLLLFRRPPPPAPLMLPRAAGGPAAGGGSPDATPSAPPEKVTVHAAGAVARPGVYTLAAGSRVADVVAAAGGAAPDADPDQLNLAAKVADADRVYVPRKGEVPPIGGTAAVPASGASAGTPGGQTVDLNAATLEQLDALPGVGPSLAQAIVTYRTRHGGFRSVEELDQVPGIGPAKLDRLRPLVRV